MATDYCIKQHRQKIKTGSFTQVQKNLGLSGTHRMGVKFAALFIQSRMHHTCVFSACLLCHCMTCVTLNSLSTVYFDELFQNTFFFLEWFLDVFPALLCMWTTVTSLDNFLWILTDCFENSHKELKIFLSTALYYKQRHFTFIHLIAVLNVGRTGQLINYFLQECQHIVN